MKDDVINWALGNRSDKLISKETLNHPELIEMVSGVNVYQDTTRAYLRAYQALGVDLINRVPTEKASTTQLTKHQKKHQQNYSFKKLGVYDTAYRHTYLCENPQQVWQIDVDTLTYEELITPVPHPCTVQDIQLRQAHLGDIGLYYPMLYTTVFMWAVEMLGWETFMIAALKEADRFHDRFIAPLAQKALHIVELIAQSSENPFIFIHDDLADARGPVFPPSWYDDYILPHYEPVIAVARQYGKKVIMVADGNMTYFLPKLVDIGFAGIMCENPATPFDAVLDFFGPPGQYFIGGIDTIVLTTGTPDEIYSMVMNVAEKARDCPGFALSSCGGLHGNIPMENLRAYFDARSEIGATPKNWKNYFCENESSNEVFN